MMNAEQFNMTDGLLATSGFHDDRKAAEDILEAGVKEDSLLDAARVVAGRYALRPGVIIEWYAEVLNRRVQETTEQIQKLTKARIDNVGSR